jgi:hypothetical protein
MLRLARILGLILVRLSSIRTTKVKGGSQMSIRLASIIHDMILAYIVSDVKFKKLFVCNGFGIHGLLS